MVKVGRDPSGQTPSTFELRNPNTYDVPLIVLCDSPVLGRGSGGTSGRSVDLLRGRDVHPGTETTSGSTTHSSTRSPGIEGSFPKEVRGFGLTTRGLGVHPSHSQRRVDRRGAGLRTEERCVRYYCPWGVYRLSPPIKFRTGPEVSTS